MAFELFLDFSASPAKGAPGLIPLVGESADPTFKKSVTVKSFSLGFSNSGAAAGGGGVAVGKATWNQITNSPSLSVPGN
jgi:hypothetical protein